MTNSLSSIGLLLGTFLISGCTGPPEPAYRKPTSVVTGQVYVDGEPVPATSPLKVEFHPTAGMDTEHPTISTALTGREGKFTISTYETGDGVPPGEYAVTFTWGKMNLIAANYGGPDQLGGKYSDPKSSTFVITVKKDAPTDMGRIDLSTDKSSTDK